MLSVSAFVSKFKQQRGGLIPLKEFEHITFHDRVEMNSIENVSPRLIGTTVDYLSRVFLGEDLLKVFNASLLGAKKIKKEKDFYKLLEGIKNNEEISIINCIKLSAFDVCYRNSMEFYEPYEDINPNKETIENIKIMLKRCVLFFKKYGPITKTSFTFEGAYNHIISRGDGDFLTKNSIWDFKVLTKNPTSKDILQLLVYYIMGKNSKKEEFGEINSIGLFNPRKNVCYILNTEKYKNIIKMVGEVINSGMNFFIEKGEVKINWIT